MRRISRARPGRALLAGGCVAVLGVLAVSPAATGTFPAGNGRLIAFSSTRGANTGVFSMHADGSHQHRLSNPAQFARDADFSPTGKLIAFSGEPLGSGDQVLVMHADGSHLRDLTPTKNENDGPAFSPNGKLIAFRRNSDVSTMHLDGSHRRQLTKGKFDADPSWSPDGRHIAYTHQVGSRDQIGIVAANGRHAHAITSGKGSSADPSFAPSGKLIAFSRFKTPTSNGQIDVVRPDGSHQHVLIGRAEHPSYSPDGRLILFDRFDGHDAELFVAHADGSHVRQLTHNTVDDTAPTWQPQP